MTNVSSFYSYLFTLIFLHFVNKLWGSLILKMQNLKVFFIYNSNPSLI